MEPILKTQQIKTQQIKTQQIKTQQIKTQQILHLTDQKTKSQQTATRTWIQQYHKSLHDLVRVRSG